MSKDKNKPVNYGTGKENDCKFEAISSITLRPNQDGKTAELLCTEFTLNLSVNMDREAYINKKGEPTRDGCHALTQAFIQGLLGSLHYAHQAGFRDSAEHLRYIISELERGFVRPVQVEHGVMEVLGNNPEPTVKIEAQDTPFFDSPDVGPKCLCSRCGKPILKGVPIRAWPPNTSPSGLIEFRYHPECLGWKQGEDFEDDFSELPFQ